MQIYSTTINTCLLYISTLILDEGSVIIKKISINMKIGDNADHV